MQEKTEKRLERTRKYLNVTTIVFVIIVLTVALKPLTGSFVTAEDIIILCCSGTIKIFYHLIYAKLKSKIS
jgi:hypothetical protein